MAVAAPNADDIEVAAKKADSLLGFALATAVAGTVLAGTGAAARATSMAGFAFSGSERGLGAGGTCAEGASPLANEYLPPEDLNNSIKCGLQYSLPLAEAKLESDKVFLQ